MVQQPAGRFLAYVTKAGFALSALRLSPRSIETFVGA
jgi:hypothetical protein